MDQELFHPLDIQVAPVGFLLIEKLCLLLMGVSEYGRDFPPLKNEGKRKRLVISWLAMIKFLRWPYINSDAELFGKEFEIDVAALAHERTESKQPPAKKTKTARSTDAETLEALADEHPLPKLILEIRQLAKLKSTYIDALPQLLDQGQDRLHGCPGELARTPERHPGRGEPE